MRRLATSLTLILALAGAWVAPGFAQVPSPVPSLPDSERRTVATLTASTGPVSVGFALYGDGTDYANWLEVWVNGVKLTAVTDWTLAVPTGTLASRSRPISDATITFVTAQTGTVQIVGARRPRRISQFSENRGVAARDLNQALTDIVAMLREGWDKINDTSGRTIQAPGGEQMTVLPTSTDRGGRYLKFDSSGNPVQGATEGAVEGATVAALTGTATDTVVIATGSKSFTTQASRQWLVGTYLTISNSSDGGSYMHGPITAYSSGTGAVTITAEDTSGSGAFNSWNLNIAGTRGSIGVTGPTGATAIGGVPTTSDFAIFGPGANKISGGGTTGYGISYNYTTLKYNTTSPPAAYGAPLNARLIPSVASNVLTIALKDANGADPTTASPAMVPFRDANPAVSIVTWAEVTAATSVAITSGSTLGFSNNIPGRIWVVGFYDAGTFRLGAIQNLSGTLSGASIYPLGGWGIASSTAEGGVGGADTSQTFYTGTAVTAKAYSVLGYLTWETPLGTAGLWTATPDRVQMFGPGVRLPGEVVQIQQTFTGSVNTGTTAFPNNDVQPTTAMGDLFMQQSITPTSRANLLEIEWQASLINTNGVIVTGAICKAGVGGCIAAAQNWSIGSTELINTGRAVVIAQDTSATFSYRAGGTTGATTTFNGNAGARKQGGYLNSHLRVKEIMN